MDAQADAGRLTALHGAAAMGHVEAIAALVGAGAALEARDKKQRTPLHLAAEHGRAAALKALLGAGAALFNIPREGVARSRVARKPMTSVLFTLGR